MAREHVIRYTDDLDKSDLEAPTVEHIGFRGFIYELDLSEENADKLADVLQPYIKSAHDKVRWPKRVLRESFKDLADRPVEVVVPAPPTKANSRTTASNLTVTERKEAREWGRANGFEVATKGALAPQLIKAYRESKARVAK